MLLLQNTFDDILKQPEFSVFAQKILLWDETSRNNPETKINEIIRLMPYHNNIVPEDVYLK